MPSEIKLLATTAMKTTLDELLPKFERATGHKVMPEYAPSPRLAKQIAEGAVTDAAIVGAQGVEDLIKLGKFAPGSRTDLARSAMAMAVLKGAKKPDISTAEKFTQTLLAAKSLGMSNPVGGGTSGGVLTRAFERLGIAEAMKGKCFYGAGGPTGLIGLMLLRGEVEIGIQQMPELMMVPGLDLVGPLPEGIQSVTTFSFGISAAARDPDAAKALAKFLTSPEATALMRAKGMET